MEILTEREVARVAPESIDQTLVEEVQRSAARAEAEDADADEAEGDETSSEEGDN